MARKKNISDIDELEKEFIEEKLKASERSISKYLDLNFGDVLSYKINIKCKTESQKKFMNELKDDSKEMCFGVGAPGTGKSFISLTHALKELKSGRYRCITMVIPTAPAGGADLNLGFIKGGLEEKSLPFKECDLETIAKILRISGNENSRDIAKKLIDGGYIKYEFVNFLLGKTLDNSIILVNEAEQYTSDNMKLILTRIGENSKFVITGDTDQVNRRSIVNRSETCGLSHAIETLSGMEEVSITRFSEDDIVRNKLITKILKKW